MKLAQIKLAQFKLASWKGAQVATPLGRGSSRTIRADRRASLCAGSASRRQAADFHDAMTADLATPVVGNRTTTRAGGDISARSDADGAAGSFVADSRKGLAADDSRLALTADRRRAAAADKSERQLEANVDG